LIKVIQPSFFRVGLVLFLLEIVFLVTLLLPVPEKMLEIISIPIVYIVPGCLILLSTKKNSVDVAKFTLNGFAISVLLGVGTSLVMGVLLGAMDRLLFMSVLITISFLSLVLIWKKRELSGQRFVSMNKYSVLTIVLAVVFFSALMLLCAYKSPAPASSDSARYFHAAENYIRSFSFSPYPPFPLNSWEVDAADLGGALDFRNLWVIIVAIPLLIVENASIAVVRTLNIFLSSMLLVATFGLGSLLSDKKTGILAALFVALTPIVIFYAPYELPYVCTTLFTLIAYSLYVSAVGGEKKNFKLAYLSLFILLPVVLFLHVTVFFFALVLILHFLFVVIKHGSKITKVVSIVLYGAFGFLGLRYFTLYSSSRFEQFLNLDLAKSIQTVYNVFLIPIYLTAPLWILFITGALLTFIYKKRKSLWGVNLLVTLCAIPFFLMIFVVFRYGVSFRFFLPLLPLISIVGAYGFLNSIKERALRAFAVFNGLYFLLIFYLANTYPFTVIFPFGRVTSNEIYLTLLPAIAVFAWKFLWKEAYGKRTLTMRKISLNVNSIVVSIFVVVVSASMISETVIYVADPWLGVYVNPVENGLQEAGAWISENIESGSVLATNAWTHLGLYVDHTKTPIVSFPASGSSLLRWVSEGKIDYLVILTNLNAPLGITWFHRFSYVKRYADSSEAPPAGTTEHYRGENFVVFKVLSGYEPAMGVIGYVSDNSQVWTLENGYIQLNLTRKAILLSYKQFAEYVGVSKLDFEETTLKIDDILVDELGHWDLLQWYNYMKNDWEEWTENSYPPQSISYLQQVKVRLLWNRENNMSYNLSLHITLERGKPYGQVQWNATTLDSNTVTIFPSIKLVEKSNRAYIPSIEASEWSTNTTTAGNPLSEPMFGLGFLLSHTPDVKLLKGDYTGQQLPSSILLPEKMELGKTSVFAFTFDVINEADEDKWATVEVYVPDELIDYDGDGFYSAGLQSYNVNDGKWWDFARWDSMDVGDRAMTIGPWADSFRATLLNGTRLSDALGYLSSESSKLGVGLYTSEKREETAQKATGPFGFPGLDAPANITYSGYYGLMSRIGFAVRLPGKNGEGSNQLNLRLYLAYNETTSITYEFTSSIDTHYGFGSINHPFIWLYNVDEARPSMGLVFNKIPSFLSFSVDAEYFYKNVNVGYTIPESVPDSQPLCTNLVSVVPENVPRTFENSSNNIAFSAAISSLAYYNFTFRQSDTRTMGFTKFKIENEFNSEPLYIIAVDERWTWISGGNPVTSLIGNDPNFDVSDVSFIEFMIQPKAIGSGALIYDQEYDATEQTLTIQLASGRVITEKYDSLIVYMLRRVFVYCLDLRPTEVYVDSKPYDMWKYDEATSLLRFTLTEIPEVEINIIFAES